jgi:hypothetical protein
MKKHLSYLLVGLAFAVALTAIIVFSRGTSEIFVYNNF